LHSIVYPHAAASVNDENEMEVSSVAEFNLLGLLILDDLEEVLRLDWVKRGD